MLHCTHSFSCLVVQHPAVGRGLLIHDVFTSHDTPQSVELLWKSDQLVAETSTWQHTTLTTDKHPCPRWDSNLRSQQASGRRPTLLTAEPLGPAYCIHIVCVCVYIYIYIYIYIYTGNSKKCLSGRQKQHLKHTIKSVTLHENSFIYIAIHF